MDLAKLEDFHRFETINEYANFFDTIIDQLTGVDSFCELDEIKCKYYLNIVNLVDYHGRRLREQDQITDDFIQFSLSSKGNQDFFRSEIVELDYRILPWVSRKILQCSNGHLFWPLLKHQYRLSSSREDFLKLQYEHLESFQFAGLEGRVLNILLNNDSFARETLLLASTLEDPDVDSMIGRLTNLLTNLAENPEVTMEHILYLISINRNNSPRPIFPLTLLVFCELFLGFDSLDGISLVRSFLAYLETRINDDTPYRPLTIDYFHETIARFIRTYLELLENTPVDNQVFFLIPTAKLESDDFKLLGHIEINHIILLIKYLLHENSPVRGKFSENLFKNFQLANGVVNYVKKLLRNL
jgi:hypothetical protein